MSNMFKTTQHHNSENRAVHITADIRCSIGRGHNVSAVDFTIKGSEIPGKTICFLFTAVLLVLGLPIQWLLGLFLGVKQLNDVKLITHLPTRSRLLSGPVSSFAILHGTLHLSNIAFYLQASGWLSLYSYGLWAEWHGFNSQQCNVQTKSGAHPFCYPVGIRGAKGGVTGLWSWPLTSIQCQNKVCCNCNPPPPSSTTHTHLHGIVCNQLGTRTALPLKNAVIWDVTPCGSYKNHHFRRMYRPPSSGRQESASY
jgi:hypothetical protein